MNVQVDLNSISMSKNDSKLTKFEKYDVEASIDEVENTENLSVFKYGFTILSNPKNVRLSIEGVTRIEGDSMERDEVLTKDENDVPKILTVIYHELFPTFFLLSKNLNVYCPPHTIGAMGSAPVGETSEILEESPEEIETGATSDETAEPEAESSTEQAESSTEQAESSTEQAESPDMTQSTV